jgi:hypothetical protein
VAHTPRLGVTARNAAANAVCTLLNSGTIGLYSGTQPATPGTAVTTQVLLAQLTFGATAYGSAVAGVSTANAITDDSDANATGDATWCRALSSGAVAIWDGSVGTSGCDCNLSSTAIVRHGTVSITSCTYTQPAT